MNNSFLSFVLISLLFQSCQQTVSVKNIQDVIVDKDSMKFMNLDSSLLNGSYQLRYSDSIIAIDGSFIEGKLDGSVSFYKPNGIIDEKGFWNKGKRDGKQVLYWDDGIISANINYKNGKLDGEIIDYWQDGSIYMENIYDNGVKLSHTWYGTDSKIVEEVSLLDNLKRSLERYIIQDYIDDSDPGMNWVKIVDDKIMMNCHCIPNAYGDLNKPDTGKECTHGTNPWSEKGVSASVFYPEVPVLVGDVNKDGVDDYILNYTIEGMGGGTMWLNNNVLIINNGTELKCIAQFQGDVKYNSIHSKLESINDGEIVTIDSTYDMSGKVKSLDTILYKYIESFQLFESIKSTESYAQIDGILTIYKNKLVESDLQNEIISKGISLLTELKYCQRASDSVWNGLSDEFAELLPACRYSDSYTVHFLSPNFLVIQPENSGHCGSGGCSIDVFKYVDGIFEKLDTSHFCTLLSQETTYEYIVEAKSEKLNGGKCYINYKRKFCVDSDTIKYFNLFDEVHEVKDTLAHTRFCI